MNIRVCDYETKVWFDMEAPPEKWAVSCAPEADGPPILWLTCGDTAVPAYAIGAARKRYSASNYRKLADLGYKVLENG